MSLAALERAARRRVHEGLVRLHGWVTRGALPDGLDNEQLALVELLRSRGPCSDETAALHLRLWPEELAALIDDLSMRAPP